MLYAGKQLPLFYAQPHLHHLRLHEPAVPDGGGDEGEAVFVQKIVDSCNLFGLQLMISIDYVSYPTLKAHLK